MSESWRKENSPREFADRPIDPNRELLERAADLLRPLLNELVFVGGCATGLLITDRGSGGVRATHDVNTTTELKARLPLLINRLVALAGSA